MKTLEEVALFKEVNALKEELSTLTRDYYNLKDKYDQLCIKLKTNANDARNEGDRFLSSYARDRSGPWDQKYLKF